MKKTGFKILSLLVVAVMSAIIPVALCACDKVVTYPQAEPYPDDFQCGYLLVFYNGDEALTSEDFGSSGAVKNYIHKRGGYLTVSEKGLPVNDGYVKFDGQPLLPDKSAAVEICDAIRYTSELKGKTVAKYNLYYDAKLREVYKSDSASVFQLSGGFLAFSFHERMGAKMPDENDRLQDITYKFDLTLQFAQVDKLVETEFSYFNAEGVQVHSVSTNEFEGDISVNGEYEYDYVVISKTFERADGSVYSKHSICDKFDLPYSETEYAPCGKGFTMPVTITVKSNTVTFG